MKFRVLIVFAFFAFCLSPGICPAQNKVVVIPLIEEVKCECTGTLSSQGRWCDQGNGTIIDMTNCLVWLKNAGWGGRQRWRVNAECGSPYLCHFDAHTLVSSLDPTIPSSDLNNGSAKGDWRLPSIKELRNLVSGTEAVSYLTPRFFTNVENYWYWSDTTHQPDIYQAYDVHLGTGGSSQGTKENLENIWPVRSIN